MSSQQVLPGLCLLPLILIALGPIATNRVDLLGLLHVLWRHTQTILWLLDEESVMHVTRWVTLWLEESVKVPEGALDELAGGHLFEAHFEEDFFELFTNLHQWMTVATHAHLSISFKVVLLECLVFPLARPQHLSGQLGLEHFSLGGELSALGDLVRLGCLHIEMLTFLEGVDLLLIVRVRIGIGNELVKLRLVYIHWGLGNPLKLITILLDPLLFHRLAKPYLCNLCSNTTFHLGHVNFLSHLHS